MARMIRRLLGRSSPRHLAVPVSERPLHPWFVSRELHLVESGVRFR